MIGVYLLLFAAAVSVLAPRLLPRAGWVYRAPRLGLAAWYAVIAATGLATVAAVVSLTVGWPWMSTTVCAWALWCLRALHGGHGLSGQLLASVGFLVVVLLGVRAGVVAWRLGQALATRRREHAGMLAILGEPCTVLGATVVDCALPVAYLMPGRPARVVVSNTAVDTLPAAQLAAVIAHEHAHAAGRHSLLADGTRLLVAAFPKTQVFAAAHAQIERLVEMRADEVATERGHDRLELARALVTMAETATARAGVPVGAVAATGGDALERVRRLLSPPAILPGPARLAVWTGLVGLTVAPVLLVGALSLVPALAGCPTLL
jgi:Zn-dependent protease with chaperone function